MSINTAGIEASWWNCTQCGACVQLGVSHLCAVSITTAAPVVRLVTPIAATPQEMLSYPDFGDDLMTDEEVANNAAMGRVMTLAIGVGWAEIERRLAATDQPTPPSQSALSGNSDDR